MLGYFQIDKNPKIMIIDSVCFQNTISDSKGLFNVVSYNKEINKFDIFCIVNINYKTKKALYKAVKDAYKN